MNIKKVIAILAVVSLVTVGSIVGLQVQRAQASELEGIIQSVSSAGVVVDGQNVIIGPDTKVEGTLVPGTITKVKARVQADGSLLAIRIKVDNSGSNDVDDDTDEVESGNHEAVELKGTVTSLTGTSLVVGSQTIMINNTRIEGNLVVGARVEVKAARQSDGSLLALKIEVNGHDEDEDEMDEDEDEDEDEDTNIPISVITALQAPTGLSAVASSGRINLTWVDNSANETGFRIERATNSAFTANLVTATVPANVTTYSDTTVAIGTAYYYRVFAYRDSLVSNMATAIVPTSITSPQAPAGLAAVLGWGQVNLMWTDNSTNEAGFRIERATNPAFTANLVAAVVSANVTTYYDTTVATDTTYHYRVLAYNAGGDSSSSNIAMVTTPSSNP